MKQGFQEKLTSGIETAQNNLIFKKYKIKDIIKLVFNAALSCSDWRKLKGPVLIFSVLHLSVLSCNVGLD